MLKGVSGSVRRERRRGEFERFVAGHADELLRTAYLVVGDLAEAEDLVQESLLRVARRWPRVSGMDHPIAYARRVVINLALDGAKRRSRQRQELESKDDPRLEHRPDESSTSAIAAVDAQAELLDALDTLPPRQRAMLVLRYFEDLSEAQVADVLCCSLGTVKSTTSRGLARLRQTLQDAGSRDARDISPPERGAKTHDRPARI